jgi:hypothetical protein
MAKKNVIIEEPEVDTPAIEETIVEETPVKFSRSNGVDAPRPEREQIGHTTRIYRAGQI